MDFTLVKKTSVKGDKKYLNFYLLNKDNNKIIPISIKSFKDKKTGQQSYMSKQDFYFASAVAVWMTGSDSHQSVDIEIIDKD